MGYRHMKRWALEHIKKRNAQVIETKHGLYVTTKGDNEPEYYKNYDDYAFYHNTYGYKDITPERKNHLRK